ncbi:MAG TPA: hypothetical protein VII98_01810 [Solirubrobacteraceae bacterium]
MSARLTFARHLFEAFEHGGIDAVIHLAPPDVVWEPFGAQQGFDTQDALRDWQDERNRRVAAHEFEEIGDCVLITGSRREDYPGGGFAESQLAWIYFFDGERLVRATGYGDESAARSAIAALDVT